MMPATHLRFALFGAPVVGEEVPEASIAAAAELEMPQLDAESDNHYTGAL